MSTLWLKIKLSTKVAVLSLVAIYVVTFVWINWGRTAQLWIWHKTDPTLPLLLYTLIVFLFGGLTTLLARTLWATIGQFRELKRVSVEREKQQMMSDMAAKAAMLQTRDREQQTAPPPRSPVTSEPLEGRQSP